MTSRGRSRRAAAMLSPSSAPVSQPSSKRLGVAMSASGSRRSRMAMATASGWKRPPVSPMFGSQRWIASGLAALTAATRRAVGATSPAWPK